MAALRNVTTEAHHSFWLQEKFDYPEGADANINQISVAPGYAIKINDARSIYRLQDAFLNHPDATASNVDDDHEMDSDDPDAIFEIKNIMGYRGEGDEVEYNVQWKGYSKREASWVPLRDFKQTRIIDDYCNSKRTF
ncbi:hypothetical protein BGZ80_000793 [Entomortierella chlamydospora]|uniref:Chromo domain-containing protein n=1 Tax=Entomortierella chlamydospora TaxID=101097 RepID=A0A9P6MS71_9FUNG|nr:hypothetical protein BGZ80_000793 [Entomortierella chlamydospora]